MRNWSREDRLQAIIVVGVIVAVLGAAFAQGEYRSMRAQRDQARTEIRVYERMLRTIEPLTDRQEQALDRLARAEARHLRELCGPGGVYEGHPACP